MQINYFDIIVSAIILLLGLKGVLNGFFKELFGLVGIIGGIFVASRVGDEVGNYLSDMIFKFHNQSAISFTGFLVTLISFWFLMIIVGLIFKKLTSFSGLGPIDRIFGFILGASKFFLIASIIAYAAYNIKSIKSALDNSVGKTSITLPILVETGAYIMKMDPSKISNDINSSINNGVKNTQENVKKIMINSTKQISESIKKDVLNANQSTSNDENISDKNESN